MSLDLTPQYLHKKGSRAVGEALAGLESYAYPTAVMPAGSAPTEGRLSVLSSIAPAHIAQQLEVIARQEMQGHGTGPNAMKVMGVNDYGYTTTTSFDSDDIDEYGRRRRGSGNSPSSVFGNNNVFAMLALDAANGPIDGNFTSPRAAQSFYVPPPAEDASSLARQNYADNFINPKPDRPANNESITPADPRYAGLNEKFEKGKKKGKAVTGANGTEYQTIPGVGVVAKRPDGSIDSAFKERGDATHSDGAVIRGANGLGNPTATYYTEENGKTYEVFVEFKDNALAVFKNETSVVDGKHVRQLKPPEVVTDHAAMREIAQKNPAQFFTALSNIEKLHKDGPKLVDEFLSGNEKLKENYAEHKKNPPQAGKPLVTFLPPSAAPATPPPPPPPGEPAASASGGEGDKSGGAGAAGSGSASSSSSVSITATCLVVKAHNWSVVSLLTCAVVKATT